MVDLGRQARVLVDLGRQAVVHMDDYNSCMVARRNLDPLAASALLDNLKKDHGKLLRQGYRYHKFRKAFSKFYHRHSELIVKYNIELKTSATEYIRTYIL